MDPDQLAAYNAWVNSGAQGAPPAWVMQNRQQAAQQQAQAQQAVQIAQQSGLGNFYDLAGVGYASGGGSSGSQPPVAQTLSGGLSGGTPLSGGLSGGTSLANGGSITGPIQGPAFNGPGIPGNGGNPTPNPFDPGPGHSWGPNPTIQPGTISGPGVVTSGGSQGLSGGTIGANGTTTQYGPVAGVPLTPSTNMVPGPTSTTAPTTTPPATTTSNPPATNPTSPSVPGNVPISWPTNPAANGPTYAGNVRDLSGELGAISSYINPFAQQSYNLAQELNPLYTQLNTANFNSAASGIAGPMRQNFDAANPQLAQFSGQLGNWLTNVAGNRPTGVSAQGYEAATASPSIAGPAATAQIGGPAPQSVQAASGNSGLNFASGQLGNLGPGGIQQTLEQQAMSDLALGKSLSAEDVRTSQQAAREGWSSRGLINSNGAVAAEVLNRDAMGRQREAERRGFASNVDQIGYGQRQGQFGSALGLSNANLGYGQLGLQGQMANQAAGLNYAQLGTANNQFNAGAQNNMAQFNAGQGQQSSIFNAGALNQAGQYNAGATNAMNQFNQDLNFRGNQNNWNNALQYGQFQQQNAINPFNYAASLTGQGPDYTGNFLGYGGDLYNTNYNAARAAEINAANISAGKQAGWMNLIGNVIGGIVPG